jgi:hypothetical protein
MFSTDFGTSRMLRTTNSNEQDQLLGISLDSAVVNKGENEDDKLVTQIENPKICLFQRRSHQL